MGGDTCRVVREGNTACCKVTVSMGEVYRTVVESRYSVLPVSAVVSKRCKVGSMILSVPDVMNTRKFVSGIPVSLSRSRVGTLRGSTRALGSILRRTLRWGYYRVTCDMYNGKSKHVPFFL